MKQLLNSIWQGLKFWFLAVWTFLQDLIGFFLTVIVKAEEYTFTDSKGKKYTYYLAKRLNNTWTGVSLGDYIVFAKDEFVDEINIRHEYGHQKQSFILGPLYLIIIGIPSFLGNIWDRITHKNWSCLDRIVWYYTQPHEHWADKIAGITLEDRGV